ncbi:uncharacterized protein LOC125478229 [Pyrus x bretschneideri]|uniref:uncharacterized protein LOC125478229 n=1 Tax=Pyrus x bretschneideri TaxID=225117 RepID=UPI00202EFB07|nr:uncharacterized protein LOC125478229 [Pyrus x bretschneideri]
MSSKVVSSVLVEQASSKPMLKPTEIVKDFKKYYGLDISYYNAWYGKESAKKLMHGDELLSYNHLAWPMLFLDGTFIKNKYKGRLPLPGKMETKVILLEDYPLLCIYPLAFAVVNSENEENWSWFLQNLSKIVTPQGRTITFISDRQKGLIEAVASVFPQSPHAFCYHHLKQNILLKYPSSLGKSYRDWIIQLFGKCAYAPTEDAFEMHLRTLMEEGGAVMRDFLKTLPKENWAAAHFPGPKYGEMCSNVAESFNAWIVDQRFLPIYQMLDGIRAKIMEMNAQRRRVAEGWKTFLCPGDHYARFAGMRAPLGSVECGKSRGFPCAHALAAILKSEGNPYEYVEDYFMAQFFKSCYDIPIVPIPDIDRYAQEENEEMLINPPLTKKPPGRPRVKRIKSSGERTRPITCSRCGTLGHHNRKTCTAEI